METNAAITPRLRATRVLKPPRVAPCLLAPIPFAWAQLNAAPRNFLLLFKASCFRAQRSATESYHIVERNEAVSGGNMRAVGTVLKLDRFQDRAGMMSRIRGRRIQEHIVLTKRRIRQAARVTACISSRTRVSRLRLRSSKFPFPPGAR